jgi:hypothetical protein
LAVIVVDKLVYATGATIANPGIDVRMAVTTDDDTFGCIATLRNFPVSTIVDCMLFN